VKITQKFSAKHDRDYSYIANNELKAYNRLHSNNITKMFASSSNGILISPSGKEREVFYVALEVASGGELFDFIFQTDRFEEKFARYYFLQLLDAFEEMQSNGVSHCDIKLSNVLLDDELNLKLTDFGFSSTKTSNTTYKGSGEYIAPEIQLGKPYNGNVVDLFAAGVLLFILTFGRNPFRRATPKDDYYKTIAANRIDLFWKVHLTKNKGYFEVSEELQDLISGMLSYFPIERPSIAEIRQHKWCKGDLPSKEELKEEFEKRYKIIKDEADKNSNNIPTAVGSIEDFDNASIHRGVTGDESDEDLFSGTIGTYVPE